jgi:hypothetical protein
VERGFILKGIKGGVVFCYMVAFGNPTYPTFSMSPNKKNSKVSSPLEGED